MDWTSLAGTLLQTGAPVIGTALGGPLGGTLGGILGKLAADALGVPATPEAVGDAIRRDPEGAAAVLPGADVKAQAELDRLKAVLGDVQDARAKQLEYFHSGSSIAFGPIVVSVVIILGFVGLSFLAMWPDAVGARSDVTLYLLGAWQSLATAVVGYWIGSSAGSADKSAQLAAIAMTPGATAAKPAKPK